MSTNCARTPTSSLTWDAQTPPAPCSPPAHLYPPTDWQNPLADPEAGLMEVLPEMFPMDKITTKQNLMENIRYEWRKWKCCVCCTESHPWTHLCELRGKRNRNVKRVGSMKREAVELLSVVWRKNKWMTSVDFLMDFINLPLRRHFSHRRSS